MSESLDRGSEDGRVVILLEGHQRVLRLLARGAPLADCLAALCTVVEERLEGALCSVLLLDPDTQCLRHGAAPGLPAAFMKAIDGEAIGPQAGSCGTAAYTGREVVVEDIRSDPLWQPYWARALPHGLLACASVPIMGGQGRVLGTFAIYRRTAGPFRAHDLLVLRAMTGLATVVIETDQRRVALTESEARFRVVAEKTGQVVFDVNVATGAAVWTGAMAATFGESALPGRGFDGLLERVPADDRSRVQSALASLTPARSPLRLEYQVRHRDGTLRTVDHHSTVLADGVGIVARHFGVLADVTDQRATEAALRERQKLDSLGLLAGGIAHDFNNVLSALLGNVNLVMADLPPSSRAAPHLETLKSTILGATDLTRQLLAYSGRGRAEIRPVNLSHVVDGMVSLLMVTVPKKVRVSVTLAPNMPAIQADIGQLQQVVMNLVTNAVEAIGDGEGQVSITTSLVELDAATIASQPRLGDLQPGRQVRLCVEDSGCGMTDDVAARIFDPFFSTKKAGRGLGLSAMLGILRAHRGGLTVTSAPGRGTVFQVFLPPGEGGALAPAPPPPPARAPAAPAGVRGLALVADDEPSIRRASVLNLRRMGFDVRQAVDGREAVEMIQAAPGAYAFVLMDLSMPRLSGAEALLEIRRGEPDLPVIISTGYGQDEGVDADAFTGFLGKPYPIEELEQLIARLLAARAAARGRA